MSEMTGRRPGSNTGHGHVWPRADGVKARCGGPKMCRECALDAARMAGALAAEEALAKAMLDPPRGTEDALNVNTIYRYEVPVDDRWHGIPLSGAVLHVAARFPAVVEFWALHTGDDLVHLRYFRIVGTGQPLPKGENRYESVRHVGTALIGQFVWHLIEECPSS